MLRLKITLLILIFNPLSADDVPTYKDLFHNMDKNIIQSFSNGYGIYHLTAAGISLGLVKSGADWQYYSYMTKNKSIPQAGFPAVIAGGLIPLAAPFYLYFKGQSEQDSKLMYSALALGQSVMVSLLVSSGYKAFTGREGPDILDGGKKRKDYSGNFNFGFLRKGVFDGWPSGHTTSAFAMAVTISEMYPDNFNVKFYSGLYAFFIGLGVTTNIHWFSDFVAGALVGYSIGKSVGQSFKKLSDGRINSARSSFYFTPSGIGFSVRF